MSKADKMYTFLVEWFDTQAELTRQYLLSYHSSDDTLEMYDVKNRRTFLKRCSYPSVLLSDLFIGAQITVYARQLRVVEYGDDFTRNELSIEQSR